MSSEYGRDWRVCIGDGQSSEVFTPLGGETSFDWKRSSQEIDLSSKDDGIYASTGYGQQKITVSVSGKVKLPDTALQALSTASKASPPQVDVQIKKGTIIKFQATCGVGNFSVTADKDNAVTYTVDLTNIGAPTTDNLGATGA